MNNSLFQNITKIFPARKITTSSDTAQVVFKLEKDIMLLGRKHPTAQVIYKRFYEDLLLYCSKMSSSTAKYHIESILNRNLVFIGNVSSSSKSGVVGTFVENKNKLAGIILEASELGIDVVTGITSNIDQCFFATYFQLIRSAVVLQEKVIVKDSDLHKNVCRYLNLLCIKFIGSNINLNDKQKQYLEILTTYFYFRFMLNKHHEQAKELSTAPFSNEVKSEVQFLITRLSKYTHMKDIFKAFIDFNITNESPNLLIMKALSKFKSFTFYSFTTSLDYLIALSIVSKYPADFCSTSLVNNSLQDQIEKSFEKYLKDIQYDVNCLSHL